MPDARRWRSRMEGGKWIVSEEAEPGTMARGVAWESVGVEDAARLDAMVGGEDIDVPCLAVAGEDAVLAAEKRSGHHAGSRQDCFRTEGVRRPPSVYMFIDVAI